MINVAELIGTHDIVFLSLDTLRYDVAVECFREGRLPNLASHLRGGWEERHAPGNFTFASHQAMFAGFLPTPVEPGKHPRLFACEFEGSETTVPETATFKTANIVAGLAGQNYHTICIGGVGFFNKQNALGRVLPGLFAESHWSRELGVTEKNSTANQFELATVLLRQTTRRVFLFINVSALHQPNHFYLDDPVPDGKDTVASQAAALAYVDAQLPALFAALQERGSSLWVVCSDHGTAYGEDGHVGHRKGLPCVWTVPYGDFILPGTRRPLESPR